MKLETLAVHAGREVEPATRAITPSITLSTTFERAQDGAFPGGHIYTRNSNPNRDALERALAALEGGGIAVAFASGNAATSAVLQALTPGDHVIASIETYYGTRAVLTGALRRWGLQADFVDMSDPANIARAMRPNTRLVWVETPSNPRLRLTDIAAAAAIAHAGGARLVCDNTFATPVLQRPLARGADLVVHSTTKYIGGHSDVLGGCVIANANDDFMQRVRAYQVFGGAAPSPFDCWLLLRSIPTLPYRVRAQSEGAMRVAAFLAAHPRVACVHYPGLPAHPGHAIAGRQMQGGFGGMLSFQVVGGEAEAMAVAARVRLIVRATSLGGVESLIEHRASVEGPDTPTPRNLLRLSVGLEHPDDLIADLAQAMA
ncbi:MAG: cystathionine gamma-synthase [Chloroflexi bacterium]|jgi:cystathionine gamma-synthase|uniref:homocysteine desulfhydrase n=1 Tax=Candidatus Thermofonsia Clade 3 bacterium TaxID=2364212 RepID=A0A2M8QG13_9CHLR|nr:PLP-dependent transferase [Candidatus Roseilinea sp. NK_OTU-006]PJF48750.1 MAG: cystathionine gamma-synthase [Candidatus Thermofonsia Clade 3 bacterium]RMG62928.1 MAG: cystathionine gamma-synthase [Chloroflexota bacterium]